MILIHIMVPLTITDTHSALMPIPESTAPITRTGVATGASDGILRMIIRSIAVLTIIVGSLGCASFVSTLSDGHPNRKTIIVPPKSEVITLAAGREYTTSGLVEIPRGAGPFRSNVGRVEKDEKVIALIQRRFNGWTLGNLLPYNGIIIGFGIDFLGGAAYSPKVVYIAPTSVK
jgi:hypothetical protein